MQTTQTPATEDHRCYICDEAADVRLVGASYDLAYCGPHYEDYVTDAAEAPAEAPEQLWAWRRELGWVREA